MRSPAAWMWAPPWSTWPRTGRRCSARDALDRLLGNALEAPHRPSESLLRRRIASNIDLVVFLQKRPEGRRVTEVIEVEPFVEDGVLSTQTLFEDRDGRLVETAARRPRVLDLIHEAGLAYAWEPVVR